MSTAPATQRCPTCERHLPLGEYLPSSRGKKGSYCHDCRRAYMRAYKAARRAPLRPTCHAEGCDTRPVSGEYCAGHKVKVAKYGDAHWQRPASAKACGHGGYVRGCGECRAHSREASRRRRERDPDRVREIRNQSARNRRDVNREYNRRWREEHRDRVRERSRRWYRENPDSVRASADKYYKTNRDRLLALGKEWRSENPTRIKEAAKNWQGPRQRATQESAVNAGLPWSNGEIAVVLNDAMTLTEMAFALGRSLASVQQKRWKLLRHDSRAVAS